MKVLVPLDRSALAEGIVAHVRRLGLRDAEPVEAALLHVLPVGLPEAERAEQRARTEDELGALTRLLEGAGIAATRHVVEADDPAGEIVERAHALEAELIALATHGRTGLARWIRGSVAERVLRGSDLPVYTANPRGIVLANDDVTGWSRVLVPLDGSARAMRVLPHVRRFVLVADAEVVLLHIDEPGQPGVHPVGRVATRHAQARAETAVAAAVERLREAGVERVRVVGRFGDDPAHEILETARELGSDLIALASHGRTGLSRWRFGSVAENVLRAADVPLLVVRAATARG